MRASGAAFVLENGFGAAWRGDRNKDTVERTADTMTRTTKHGSKGRVMTRRGLLKAGAGTAALLAAARLNFPAGAFAQASGPEVTKAIFGYIALMDASPLVIAKEKGFFAKHGMPDVEVSKQASWGATRDNLVLGGEKNGIDGAHILTPMPYLISAGKVTQNNVPTPMYILARLNLDAQAISVSNDYKALKVTAELFCTEGSLREEEGRGQGSEGRDDLPGRHP